MYFCAYLMYKISFALRSFGFCILISFTFVVFFCFSFVFGNYIRVIIYRYILTFIFIVYIVQQFMAMRSNNNAASVGNLFVSYKIYKYLTIYIFKYEQTVNEKRWKCKIINLVHSWLALGTEHRLPVYVNVYVCCLYIWVCLYQCLCLCMYVCMHALTTNIEHFISIRFS